MAPAKGAGEGPGAGTWAWATHKQNAAQRETAATVARRQLPKRCKREARRLGRASLRVSVTALFTLRGNTLTSNDDDRDHLAGVGVHLHFVLGPFLLSRPPASLAFGRLSRT